MKLTILTENVAGGIYAAEHGLSYLLECDNNKILFDTGHSDIFIRNAEKLNINLDEVETVVLSHGHWDHGNGLELLENKKLITHPASFKKRFRKKDNSYLGISNSRFDLLSNGYEIIETKEPYLIYPNIFFLGEVPRLNSFEAKTTSFIDENGKDDSALAIIDKNELVVISGCSHSGICNIIEYAKRVSGIEKVKTVFGGFHLKENNTQTKETINYFKKNSIKNIYPSHCTELPALVEFYNKFKIMQVKSGMVYNL